ncbi:MAG: PEP-CTERM sorting domain-containing protein [Verrucomicrobia bacterium]|nr:PEP-CTERM sorting domain-containing protein [Verrucomicrobiota bacterium]
MVSPSWIRPIRDAVWLAGLWVLVSTSAWAQGVLNTTAGQGLVSGAESFRYGREFELPVVRFQFGFTTDELVRDGVIPDAFTVSIVDEQGGVAMILATADAGGVVWAPLTPGTTPVTPEQVAWTPIPYSSLDPVQAPGLSRSVAFDLEFALSPDLADRDLKVYFDLFNNDDEVASQAWYSQPVVVPEPSSVVLLVLGAFALVWGIRRGRPGFRASALWMVAGWIASVPGALQAADPAEKAFRLNEAEWTLAEVTPETAVYFRSMRLNRALNVWNVEVTISNRSDRVLGGPLVLLVDSQTGTPGPVGPDGLDDSQPRKAYYDWSAQTGDSALSPGEVSAPVRSLSMVRYLKSSRATKSFCWSGGRRPKSARTIA